MLAATPEIANYSFATAALLGDVARVREGIERDPGAAARPDARWGWTPVHAVCGSRWHRLDRVRADGLLAVVGLLLDAGADLPARVRGDWSPLRCAVASTANPSITRLLLKRGAVPEDHDLHLACFGEDDHQCLRLLLEAGADPRRPLPGEGLTARPPRSRRRPILAAQPIWSSCFQEAGVGLIDPWLLRTIHG